MRALVLPLVAVVALAACGPSPSSTSGRTGANAPAGATTRTLKLGEVKGNVIAPTGWKAGDKAPATAIDAAKKKYSLMEKGEAVANVEVWLGTPKGERFKGPTVATTNAKGEFVITGVPRDLSYVVYTSVVNAKGEVTVSNGGVNAPIDPPPQPFCTIMQPPPANQPPRPVTISFASTLVVQDLFKDLGNQLGKVDWNAFGKAVVAVDAKLDVNALPNLNDPKAITGFLATVTVDGKAVTDSLDALKGQIKATGVSAADVQSVLNGLPTINVAGSGAVSQDGQTVAAGGGEGTLVVPQGIDLSGLFGPDPAPAASTAPAPSPTASPAS